MKDIKVITISTSLSIPMSDVEFSAIRAQGAGGQNVNKVSSAIHLRFNIANSHLPDALKTRLLARKDKRITHDGQLIIKAQKFRTQEKNKLDAIARLTEIIESALHIPIRRIATKPSMAAKRKRTDNKSRKGAIKQLRQKVSPNSY